MRNDDKIKRRTWKESGLGSNMQRQWGNTPKPANYIAGETFDALLDDMVFNRMLRLRNLSQTPQGHEPGKVYWDAVNKKAKIWVDETGEWADIIYTSTSTSTTSSSSSSTSTT